MHVAVIPLYQEQISLLRSALNVRSVFLLLSYITGQTAVFPVPLSQGSFWRRHPMPVFALDAVP